MIKATYTSVWDNGTIITTDCQYDPETKTVTDIEVSDVDPGDATLEREYVEVNGVELDENDGVDFDY